MEQILFILIAMAAIFIQALVGFGGTLLAMPLGIMAVGIALAKPVMTVVAWIAAVAIVVMDFRYIDWRELLKMTGVMLVGVLGGLWISGKVQLQFLLIVYALVVMGIGIKKMFFPAKRPPSPLIKNGSLAIAGIMQGLFVSGGSFLAVYSVAQISEKRVFRATVNAVWAVINIFMIVSYWINGALTRPVLILSAESVVPTLVAVWLGAVCSERVNQKMFLKIIYIILIASGAVLLVTNL